MFIKEFGYIYALQKGLAQLSNRRKTLAKKNGDVAQLARVLDWQSRGRGFESLWLHCFFTYNSLKTNYLQVCKQFLLSNLYKLNILKYSIT